MTERSRQIYLYSDEQYRGGGFGGNLFPPISQKFIKNYDRIAGQ